jgi:hypothetical protein
MHTEPRQNSRGGIFLLFDGLLATIIESQVLNHVVAMCKHGVDMEIWVFTPCTSMHKPDSCLLQRVEKLGITLRLFKGVDPALPYSEAINALLLKRRLKNMALQPSFIHARTEYAASVAARLLPSYTFSLLWDARGDTLSEARMKLGGWPWWKRGVFPLKENAIKRRLRKAAASAHGAIFVSDALRQLQGPDLPLNRTLVLPCVADEHQFFFSDELRRDTRQRLGFTDHQPILIYVGSTAIWQCIHQTVDLIQQALHQYPACEAVIISPDQDSFNKLIAPALAHRIKIVSAALNNINAYLNAADFGLLLREESPVNFVASPVKHAEYCLAGLKVVSTNAVDQIVQIGSILDNHLNPSRLMQELASFSPDLTARMTRAVKARRLLSREPYLEQIRSLYTSH